MISSDVQSRRPGHPKKELTPKQAHEERERQRAYQADYYRRITLPKRNLSRKRRERPSPEEKVRRQRERMKAWRAANPEILRAYAERHKWSNRPPEERERHIERTKAWQRANPERVRRYQQRYLSKPEVKAKRQQAHLERKRRRTPPQLTRRHHRQRCFSHFIDPTADFRQ